MKSVFIFFAFLVCHSVYGQSLNQTTYKYNVLRYGAIRDSTVDNTTAFQNTIDTCHAHGGGIVYIPAGVWLLSKINLGGMPDVSLLGEEFGTIFKSNTADTLINSYNTGFNTGRNKVPGIASIKNISLRGHGVGTVGIGLYYNYWFKMENITVDSFAVGLTGKGTLTGEFDNVQIEYCPYDVVLDSVNLTGGFVAPNLLQFNNCRFYYASTWGFNVKNSQGCITIRNCDFEFDGTLHNPNTGSIQDSLPSTTGTAMLIENSWFESAFGSVVYFNNNASSTSYSIINCQMHATVATSIGIRTHFPSHAVYLNVIGTPVNNDSVDYVIDGNTFVTLQGSPYGTDNEAGAEYLYFINLNNYLLPWLQSNSPTPGIFAKNGAGTSPTISLSAWATAFEGDFTVTTGTTPAASDTLCYLNYAQQFTSGLSPILYPANSAAASLSGSAQVWAIGGTGSPYNTYILTNSTALAPSTTYKWHYIIAGK